MTGWRASGIRNKFTDLLSKEDKGLSLKDSLAAALEMSRNWHIPLWKLIISGIRFKRLSNVAFSGLGTLAAGVPRYYNGVIKGDAEWGWLPAGQVVGRIDDIPTCKELIERIVEEAENILEQIRPMFSNKDTKS